MNAIETLQVIEGHVKKLFQDENRPLLTYHDINHTQQVVKVSEQMGAHYHLNEEDLFILLTAGWLHDIGYLYCDGYGHEFISSIKAEEFLRSIDVPQQIIEKVKNCILATQIPQKTQNLLEQIICDADLFHLGTPEFDEMNKNLKREVTGINGHKPDPVQWLQHSIHFMENHQYHTAYAKSLLEGVKAENIELFKNRLNKKIEEIPKVGSINGKPENITETHHDKADQSERRKEPDRGIETMFRLTSANHMDLSSMADSKANIMISVNSIIVSVLLSVLFQRLQKQSYLILPTIIFLAVCVTTIIFAILATRPKITSGKFTHDDIQKKRANLLFFGNFHKMPLEEYEWGIKEVMKDREFLYSSMIRDIYNLGVVLGKKYKLLRIAYNVFMYGFVLSVLAFAIALWFQME